MEHDGASAISFDPDFSAKLPQDGAFGPILHPGSPAPGTPFCRSDGLIAPLTFRKRIRQILNCRPECSAQELLDRHPEF
jgi:hypothetical protein